MNQRAGTAGDAQYSARPIRVEPVEQTIEQGTGCGASVEIAEQSPFGRRALRVRPREGNPDPYLTDWLQAQPWVVAVARRPAHVYVLATTDALCAWAANVRVQRPPVGERDARRHVVLELGWSGRLQPRSLTHLRIGCVANSLAALLVEEGHVVENVWRGQTDDADSANSGNGWIAVHGGFDQQPSRHLAVVGAVDVPHGPLRARHGGAVSATDLLREIESTEARRDGRSSEVPADTMRARALLWLAVQRVPRPQRVLLDDRALVVELTNWDNLRRAHDRRCSTAREKPGVCSGAALDRAVRNVATELLTIRAVVDRARRDFDPAHLARAANSLAAAATRAEDALDTDRALRSSATAAIERLVALLGLGDFVPNLEPGNGGPRRMGDATDLILKEAVL